MAPPVLAGVAIAGSLVGSGISAAGQVAAGKARSRAAREEAEARFAQADEVLRRADINVQRAQRQASELEGRQIGAFARGGVALAGSALMFIEETQARAREDIAEIRISARKNAENIVLGGKALEAQAGSIQSAANLGAFGTVFGGVAGAAGSQSANILFGD